MRGLTIHDSPHPDLRDIPKLFHDTAKTKQSLALSPFSHTDMLLQNQATHAPAYLLLYLTEPRHT